MYWPGSPLWREPLVSHSDTGLQKAILSPLPRPNLSHVWGGIDRYLVFIPSQESVEVLCLKIKHSREEPEPQVKRSDLKVYRVVKTREKSKQMFTSQWWRWTACLSCADWQHNRDQKGVSIKKCSPDLSTNTGYQQLSFIQTGYNLDPYKRWCLCDSLLS